MANKIVIHVEGGVVQDVYASDPQTDVVIMDYDNYQADCETEEQADTCESRFDNELDEETEGLTPVA